ncbi:hypothetical protein [Amycolatopsis sulphurea]|uniref:hypothetical protein n=1 Tax=Amycolatopsis sulphurea TaxID=76022 RepID=UPI0036CE26B5
MDILRDALAEDLADELVPPGHADLREYLVTVAGFLTTTADAGAMLRVLLGQAQHDPDLAARLRTEHLRGRHAPRPAALRPRRRARGTPGGFRGGAGGRAAAGTTGAPVPREFTDALVERFFGGPGRDG